MTRRRKRAAKLALAKEQADEMPRHGSVKAKAVRLVKKAKTKKKAVKKAKAKK